MTYERNSTKFKTNFDTQKFPFGFWVAENETEILGWCSILPAFSHPLKNEKEAEVSTYISKKYKKNGLGTGLMKFVFDTIKNSDIKNVWGFANSSNTFSIKMCENAGMKICGKTSIKTILIKEF